jgi:hypothetical protein
MLTLFACPKSFENPHTARIQRRAIESWLKLSLRPEIILAGEEAESICREYGLRHVPQLARTEFGTPILSDLFGKVQQAARHDLLCYLNADIVLLDDFSAAVRQVAELDRPFVLTGGRANLDVERYDAGAREGSFVWFATDYFVFRRGEIQGIPPLLLGRSVWDGWLLWKWRDEGAWLIDAGRRVTALHLNHDYRHVRDMMGEYRYNIKAAGPSSDWEWGLKNASHVLTEHGVKRIWGRRLFCFLERVGLVVRYQWRAVLNPALGLTRRTPNWLRDHLRLVLPTWILGRARTQ